MILLLIISALMGCVSDGPPPPPPIARQQAEAIEASARRHTREAHWSSAAVNWQEAANRYALLNNQASEAVAWHNLAIAQKNSGAPELAVESLRNAAKLNRSLFRWNEWWRNQIALLQIRSQLQQYRELTTLLEELAPKASAIEDPETRGLFLNELGLWQWRQGDLDMSRDTFGQALRQLEKAGSESGQATVLANQALVSESAIEYTQAVSLWRRARERFEKLGDPRGIAEALAGQGRSLLALETAPEEAEDLLRRAAHNFHLLNMAEEQAGIEELLKTPSTR
jgi:tetratricopeptide (TPR) repeat protein